jgi:hypothetical protein
MLDGAVCQAQTVRRYFGKKAPNAAASATSGGVLDHPPSSTPASRQKALAAGQRLGERFA